MSLPHNSCGFPSSRGYPADVHGAPAAAEDPIAIGLHVLRVRSPVASDVPPTCLQCVWRASSVQFGCLEGVEWNITTVTSRQGFEPGSNNHPDSCEISLRVANTDAKLNDCVKLLGVYNDYELKFTNHVDHLCKRTSWQLSAIRRIAKYLNKDYIMKLFNAFILSNFNYSSIVWHFCPSESTSKVEKIHKSALRIVLNDYKSNHDTLLQLSNLQPLLISRFKVILYEVYKCTREINPSFMNELFSKIIHPYHTRSGSMLTQLRASSIKYGISNFVFQGAKLWNSLPASAKGLENPYHFKSFLEEWNGPECKCGYCILCSIKTV